MLMHFMYFNCTKFQGVVQPIFTIFQKISLSAKIHIKFATILYILRMVSDAIHTLIKQPNNFESRLYKNDVEYPK